MEKELIIFIDRDGTIEYDKKYHLGHQRNWKLKMKLLPKVVIGLKRLNKIKNSKIYILTNQPGVAITTFQDLTMSRANEVCKFLIKKLEKKGVKIDGFKVCGKSSTQYAKTHPKFRFDPKLVGDFDCIKPNTGMVDEILKERRIKNPKIYVLGDRFTDVKTALNANGIGILIPFSNRPDELDKVNELNNKNAIVAKDFLDAVKIIEKEN